MVILLLFCASCTPAHSNTIQTGLISTGIEMVFEQRFDEARTYIVNGSRGNEAIAQFLTHWVQLVENCPDSLINFRHTAEARLKDLKKIPDLPSADYNFYEGLWNGLIALYLVERNELPAAYKFGRRAYERLRQCLEEDQQKYDAYYGLGLYHKMKFELGNSCWFVPKSSKDRKIASKYFKIASDKGIFTRELSRHMLIELAF